ncbi:hypothetical protein FC99_GL002143 [Levilactobacillus koreensis JCM 16448]|uniref:CopG family transcriptional regulator n=1 Tax=Levilactobacillus koreensis TaxID=637971 RepID=A0AAC8UWD7_9LACO|nr:hypothetical protein [Levilactobacillus koreensis]AKP64974.1 hypothetical protein ABN16_08130 [Levilactobacillus koreensis]KRK85915.1 hypothetical protein FC99_GL002143 [Levilactobacillus koreensis JCM 16448]
MNESQSKISANLSPVDVGYIDLLVKQGSFTSRTDFLHEAIRKELEENQAVIQATVNPAAHSNSLETLIGSYTFTDADILKRLKDGERSKLLVVGKLNLLGVNNLASLFATLKSITVFGKLEASPDVVAHYK